MVSSPSMAHTDAFVMPSNTLLAAPGGVLITSKPRLTDTPQMLHHQLDVPLMRLLTDSCNPVAYHLQRAMHSCRSADMHLEALPHRI